MEDFDYQADRENLNNQLDSKVRHELEEEIRTGYGELKLQTGGNFQPPNEPPHTVINKDEFPCRRQLVRGADGILAEYVYVDEQGETLG